MPICNVFIVNNQKKYANCTDVETRRNEDSDQHQIDLGRHLRDPDDYTARRSMKQGGFCEVLTLYYSKYYPIDVCL